MSLFRTSKSGDRWFQWNPVTFQSKNPVTPVRCWVEATRFTSSCEANPQTFCNVIKLGTFCRTVVWPCLPPLMMYQYIRGKDEDMYATELLYYKSGSKDPKAFWDSSRLRGFFPVMASIGELAILAHKFVTAPQANAQTFCNVIKLGTFCRTVVWPCLPPLMMYQYIRGKDEDMYATELLYYKSGSKDPKAFWDSSRLRGSGHWRMMQDLETIRATANTE
ncbi:unnamed protein product [Effrenium voratum]|uniref:Uncharacterized protein n=1 Tax=Effrenium voratum TaxID=2562239 RepID=A0AA36JSN3_9DINO|nr:unnamed protein product [Effrenium voratum]